jgi:hypothetical protein
MMKLHGFWAVLSLVTILVASLGPSALCQQSAYTRTFVDSAGVMTDEVAVPPSPPPPGYFQSPAAEPAIVTDSAVTLSTVCVYDWAYGCSAVSAGMMMGYYDRTGYNNMYAGPANGGVAPTANTTWGHHTWPSCDPDQDPFSHGECPFIASHQGIDGRNIPGYVDDYYTGYVCEATDPYVTAGRTQHTADCTGDFMGTSQNRWHMCDGATMFYYNSDNSAKSNYTACESSGYRDGCHGMRLFAESRGYTVTSNYNQRIYGYGGHSAGFTYDQFKAEIDAGRPVIIQLAGHTMLGYGYDSASTTIYICNTWDHSGHAMTWGSTYSGMAHQGVTVLHLGSIVIETPTFNPGPGVYPGPVSVAVSCATSGATIHYTTNGLAPTESDPVVASGGTVVIPQTGYLKAYAVKANMTDSAVKTALYGALVAAPTLSLAGGTYAYGTTVTMTSTTDGAEIHYTTNGVDPTTSDPIATGPVPLTQSCALKAKAFKTNWVTSATTTGNYTVVELLQTPTFDPVAGVYPGPISVTVGCANSGVTIHYTTNGLTPAESDPVIANGGTVTLTQTGYLKAMAMKAGCVNSSVKSALYGAQVAAPSMSLADGLYESGSTVMMASATDGAVIHYTTNGVEPAAGDPVATGPLELTHACALKASAFKANWVTSSTTTRNYSVCETMGMIDTKLQPNDVTLSCHDGIVSLALADAFFMETQDRVAGIRVNLAGHGFAVGTRVNVVGTLDTSGGERCIDAAYAYETGAGSIRPIYMRCRDLGGVDWFYNASNGAGQQGVISGGGPNNIGLLVRTSGSFAAMTSTRFKITDATGCEVECVVPEGVVIDPNWRYVGVTGVSGCESAGGSMIKRVLWVGGQAAIVPFQTAP